MVAKTEIFKPINSTLKVFISYSRRDATAADALVDSLSARGFEVTIDRRHLEFGEKWQAELAEFIRLSDTVIWLISETSIRSDWVNWELDEVARRNKRLVPVMVGETPRDRLPRQLGEIHILPAEGLFDILRHLDALVRVLETNHAWLKDASRLADRAHEWLAKGRSSALLLRGGPLTEAGRWKDRRPDKAPAPGQQTLDLILASRQAATKRQRHWITGLFVLFIGSLSLAVFAMTQREAALRERDAARISESSQLAIMANQQSEKHNYAEALRLALKGLPSGPRHADRPLVTDTLLAMNRALYSLRELRRLTVPVEQMLVAMPAGGTQLARVLTDGKLLLTDLAEVRSKNESIPPRSAPFKQIMHVPGHDIILAVDEELKLYKIDVRAKDAQRVEIQREVDRILAVSPHGDLAILCDLDTNRAVPIDIARGKHISGLTVGCDRTFVFPQPGTIQELVEAGQVHKVTGDTLMVAGTIPIPSSVSTFLKALSPRHTMAAYDADEKTYVISLIDGTKQFEIDTKGVVEAALVENIFWVRDDSEIRVFDLQTKRLISKTDSAVLPRNSKHFVLSPGGFSIASTNNSGGITLLGRPERSSDNWSQIELCCHIGNEKIEAVSFIDEQLLATYGQDESLRVWTRALTGLMGQPPEESSSRDRQLVILETIPDDARSAPAAVGRSTMLGKCSQHVSLDVPARLSRSTQTVGYQLHGVLSLCDTRTGDVFLRTTEEAIDNFALDWKSHRVAFALPRTTVSDRLWIYERGKSPRTTNYRFEDIIGAMHFGSSSNALILSISKLDSRATDGMVPAIRIFDLTEERLLAEITLPGGASVVDVSQSLPEIVLGWEQGAKPTIEALKVFYSWRENIDYARKLFAKQLDLKEQPSQ